MKIWECFSGKHCCIINLDVPCLDGFTRQDASWHPQRGDVFISYGDVTVPLVLNFDLHRHQCLFQGLASAGQSVSSLWQRSWWCHWCGNIGDELTWCTPLDMVAHEEYLYVLCTILNMVMQLSAALHNDRHFLLSIVAYKSPVKLM